MSDIQFEIPDRMQPLLGIRQFFVATDGTLMSPNRGGNFWNSDWKTAECQRHRFDERPRCVRSPNPNPERVDHEAPCDSCGLYVGYSYENLMSHITPKYNERTLHAHPKTQSIVQSNQPLSVIYGLVAARGLVIKSQEVMRVEQAKIIAFAIVPHEAPAQLKPHNVRRFAYYRGLGCVVLSEYPNSQHRRQYYGGLAEAFNCDYWEPTMAKINKDERR